MPPPFPWQVTPSLRSSEIVGNHTDFSGGRGLYTQTFGIVMNRAAYERLPENLRAIVNANSGMELAAAAGWVNDGTTSSVAHWRWRAATRS